MTASKTLCLIASRNLGDITIVSTFFRRLAQSGVADRHVVWTRPGMAFLFDGIADCTVIESSFPVGTNKGFNRRTAAGFLQAARQARALRPTWTVDYMGDFRERLFARMAGSRSHLHIGWAAGHAYREIIRNPFGDGHPAFTVPADMPNVYAGYDAFTHALVRQLGGREPVAAAAGRPARASASASARRVGLHPFASQDCRRWPAAAWTALAGRLLEDGVALTAFGTPLERPELEAMFGAYGDRVSFFTRSLPDFVAIVPTLDAMVGLDSFSIHVAERAQRPSVMINGANDPTLFAPPHSLVLKSSGGCSAWPCYNRPTCVGSAAQYVCIRSIGVEQAVDAVQAQLAGRVD